MMDDYTGFSVQELTLKIKEGSISAFKIIYDRYWHLLMRHTRRYLDDDEQSKDIVQEVLTSLWEFRDNLDIDFNLSSYLYRSTRNKIIDKIRHTKMYHFHLQNLRDTSLSIVDATDHLAREKDLAKIIEEEIGQLPDAVRQIFRLRRNENMTTKEVSEFLGISESTVKNQMNKAIRILRSQLGKSLFLMI